MTIAEEEEARELFWYAVNCNKELDADIRQLLTEEEVSSQQVAILALKTIELYRQEYCDPDWETSEGTYGVLKVKLLSHLKEVVILGKMEIPTEDGFYFKTSLPDRQGNSEIQLVRRLDGKFLLYTDTIAELGPEELEGIWKKVEYPNGGM